MSAPDTHGTNFYARPVEPGVQKTLLQDGEIERVPETGVAASCCALVLTIFSIISIVMLFPLSMLYVIKVV